MSRMNLLMPNNFYHIYSQSIERGSVFIAENNYKCFLEKFNEFISPISQTYAYCLLPNHFSFLIKLNSEEDIFSWLKKNQKIADDTINLQDFKNLSNRLIENFNPFSAHISKQFSSFFIAYNKSLNKEESKIGREFYKIFGQELLSSEEQLRDTLLYIHANPVRHGFINCMSDWKYSSFNSLISDKLTQLKRTEAVALFDNIENFKFCHQEHNQKLVQKLESKVLH